MKKKDGRPPRSLSAWRALQACGELEARFPDVALLVDTLAGNVDPAHVETALANAIGSLKTARGRSRESLPAPASVDERRLHAAANVERLAQDRYALERLAVAVKAELDGATADLPMPRPGSAASCWSGIRWILTNSRSPGSCAQPV